MVDGIGRLFRHQEAIHGADIDSDGDIAGHSTDAMHDSRYGGDLIKYGGERFANFYERKVTPQMRQMERDVEHTLRQLDTKIANTDDPATRRELEDLKAQVQSEWDALQDNPPPVVNTNGSFSLPSTSDLVSFQRTWEDRLDRMGDILHNAQTEVGTAGAQSGSPGSLAPAFSPLPEGLFDGIKDAINPGVLDRFADLADRFVGALSGSDGTSGAAEASGTDGTDSTSSATGADETGGADASENSGGADGASEKEEWVDIDVNKMLNQMSTDPQAVMDQLQDMPLEQRGHVMQMMNTQLQQLNQMFSMMSNMMKSMHDTAKAAINNMRV